MEIEQLIKEANKNPTKWNECFDLLFNSNVFIAINQPADSLSQGELDVNNLAYISIPNRGEVYPFFTTKERMKALGKSPFNFMEINALSLFKIIKDKPAILNPNSDCGKLFSPFEVKVLTLEMEKLQEE